MYTYIYIYIYVYTYIHIYIYSGEQCYEIFWLICPFIYTNIRICTNIENIDRYI
jgi:hypothetical protein